jgi:dicarboxylate transporter 10
MFEKDPSRISRWYFGGLGAMGAATFTHPIDLIKVILQTPAVDASAQKPTIVRTTVQIVKQQGILALYNGLTASWLRQATYSMTRFGIYETSKQIMSGDSTELNAIPFYKRVILAGVSGAAGGFVGTPADMINVRMQNDIKLPQAQRRNYKHGLHGLFQVYRLEGVKCLFNGATTATSRAVLMTIGQIAFYGKFFSC